MNEALFVTKGKGFDKYVRTKRGMISSLEDKSNNPHNKNVLRKMILAVKPVQLWQKSVLRVTGT